MSRRVGFRTVVVDPLAKRYDEDDRCVVRVDFGNEHFVVKLAYTW
jgi:hypothetical protein